MFGSVYNHLRQNGLLTSYPSCFQPGDSTVNQLLSGTHKVYCSFENVPAISCCISRAIKSFWHGGLLHKLECNGISGNLLTLLRSVLTVQWWLCGLGHPSFAGFSCREFFRDRTISAFLLISVEIRFK